MCKVVDRVETKDDYVKYCAVKRSVRYRGKLPRNILRHIILSEVQGVMVHIEEVMSCILHTVLK